ncbi:MAG: hypothetical protein V1807_01700 [Patescibacteria group bacterium]
MNFLNIFKLSYYFDSYAGPELALLWPLVILMVIVLAGTIVLNIRLVKFSKQWIGERKFWWAHWLNIGYTFSITGLAGLFFRYESIPYFNWRFWPALMIVGIVGWIGYLIYYRYKLLPQKRADQVNRQQRAYYFRRRRK